MEKWKLTLLKCIANVSAKANSSQYFPKPIKQKSQSRSENGDT